MARRNLNLEGGINGGECKIRKRGCSSSSSSSLVKNYRLKRAILVGKRGGSSTPVPTWKMSTRSPSLQNAKSMKYLPVKGGCKGKEISMSARKLAATLWEINEVPLPRKKEYLEEKSSKVEMGSKKRIFKTCKFGSMALHLFDLSHSPVSERMDRDQRRKSVGSHKLLLIDNNLGGLDSIHNASLVQVEPQPRDLTPSRYAVGVKTRLKDVSNGLTTSKELLKVFNRIWGLEEQHSTSKSLISALQVELDRARIQVKSLIQEQQCSRNEIDFLLKQLVEEREAWKIKEQDRIHNAITSIAAELEVEKKLRKQTERLNKKLGRELAYTKASLSKTVKELESEKRAREILEQVSDELARGIGEDRAEVEELKKELVKVREEVEKERKMLQLADVLREERVQMKLSEAKYQFEEKNAALDKLRSELEAYLIAKIGEEKDDGSPNNDRIKELEEYLRKTLGQNGERQMEEREEVNREERGEEDSADSDLHSIELNMDNNRKSFEWSYACEVPVQNDSQRILVYDKIMGRKPVSERAQQKSVSIERKPSDGIEWEFSNKHQDESNGFVGERFSNLASQAWKKDCQDEIERNKMIKDLRDQILSGAGLASSQGFASWPRRSQELSRVVCEGLAVLQEAV